MMQNVLVFGRGRYFQKKAEAIKQKYHVTAFVDNNRSKINLGDDWNRVPIISPEEVDNFPQYSILIMVSWQFVNEVVKQLVQLGITRDRIILGVNEEPHINETEEWLNRNRAAIEVEEDGALLFVCSFGKYLFNNRDELTKILLELYQKADSNISFLKTLSVENPVKTFGSNRGNPIDRYYIEHFLSNNSIYIHGNVGEMGEPTYTDWFGHDLRKKYIFHVNQKGENIKNINLETGEGIEDELLDCFICTQTISFIYDIHSTIKNIWRLLKKDGVAMITVPGICKISMGDYEQWGDYWRFSKQSLLRLIKEEKFDLINIVSNGNIKTAMCFLYGMTVEDLTEEDFAYNDEQFPVVVSAIIRKK